MTFEPTLAAPGTPPAEFEIDADLVRRLLEEQHPDLTDLELGPAASGWDNSNWRLGADLAVRVPRRELGARLIRSEQDWLGQLAPRLPVPISEPVRAGRATSFFPWPWSVVRWIEGRTASEAPLEEAEAATLGAFLAQLHTAAPTDAPHNPFRGVPLANRADAFAPRIQRLGELAAAGNPAVEGLDLGALRQIFESACAEAIDRCGVWIHGDLHPKNVISQDGRLAAVVDWGDLTSGDAANDLSCVWMHFPARAHRGFWEAYGEVSGATKLRALGWAVLMEVMLLDTGIVNDVEFVMVG